MSLEFLTVNCIVKKIYPTFFNFKNVAHCFAKKIFQNLFHVDDALGMFEKLTIVPESESITDDIMRYNLVF